MEDVKLISLDPNDLDHLNLMYAVRTHPEVDRELSQSPPHSFNAHVEYLQKTLQTGKKRFFLIGFQENLCGYCHVTGIETNTLELGFALHPLWWGKGIGKCAVCLLVQLLEGYNLTLIVKKSNLRALLLYQKCGFVILKENDNQEYLMEYSRDTET